MARAPCNLHTFGIAGLGTAPIYVKPPAPGAAPAGGAAQPWWKSSTVHIGAGLGLIAVFYALWLRQQVR